MRSNRVRIGLAAAASALAMTVMSSAAHAGAFALREQSAAGQGMSFAGVGAGSAGLGSMFWNPATITSVPGIQSNWSAALVVPTVKITPQFPTPTLGFGGSGDIGQDAVLASSYGSYQVNDKIWLGISTSAPYGLVTDPRQAWAGQVYSRSSRIFSFNVNPVIGYKINDWISVAAGPSVEYFKTTLKRATGVAPTAASAILEGDNWGFGYTMGLTLNPMKGTTIGVGFRSSVHHGLEGTLNQALPIKANLNTPETVTVGLTQEIGDRFTLALGAEWTNWSRLGTVCVQGLGGCPTALILNYKDGWFYSIGASYKIDERWTVRAGLAYEVSPIDEQIRSTRLPDNDRIWTSVGASYAWNNKLTFDAGYTYIFPAKSTRINIVPGQQEYAGLPFVGKVNSNVHIVSLGIKYRWDDVSKTIPVVAKY